LTIVSVYSPAKRLRVVLADDHHIFREGLRGMLQENGMVVVGEAADGTEATRLAGELAPDVVVLDLNMPGISGAEAARQIVTAHPKVRVVVMTVSAAEDDVMEALGAGACGYLLKDMRLDHVIGGIRQAASGQAVLSREALQALITHERARRSVAPTTSERPALTARELDVLRLIVEGADNAAIGRELSISRHTVKQYVTNIFEKLDVRGRVEAAVYAVRAGLV
jgi:DNA-binding NarL/FixJ family response regulator